MPLHPFITMLIEKQKAAGWPGLAAGSPDDARALVAAARGAIGPGPEMEVRTLMVPTREGAIPARLYLPKPEAQALVVYLHGGGWVVGALDDYDTLARTLAARSGAAVLLPDYRLAPEHRFPAGLNDVEDVLVWAASGAWQGPPGSSVPLIVAGDSAGANLGTAALRLLDGRVSARLQVLVYPVADCDMTTASYRAHGEGLPLTTRDMVWFFDHYAPTDLHADPRISPLRAENLSGLPPALIMLAEYDVLHDEGQAYAEKLRAAGVPVEVKRYEGVTHGFLRLHTLFDIANGAVSDIAGAIHSACPELHAERP